MTEPTALPPVRVPPGLGKAGRALWRSFAAYVLDPREQLTLTMAARQADNIATLETALADGGAIVEGSKRQPVLNAGFAELRMERLALSRLLGTLDLPAEDAGRSVTAAQMRGQKAANTRWDLKRTRLAPRSRAVPDGSLA